MGAACVLALWVEGDTDGEFGAVDGPVWEDFPEHP